jgi:hypothetical protein
MAKIKEIPWEKKPLMERAAAVLLSSANYRRKSPPDAIDLRWVEEEIAAGSGARTSE